MTDRETQIIAAATALFLSDGVGVSTARIAKAAGVSNGSLFNAFPSKQALINSMYRLAKTAMFASLIHSGASQFTRATLYENWQGYLAWARAHPEQRDIMHLLLDAGLVSADMRAEVEAFAAAHAEWVQNALDRGLIRGPNMRFVIALILFQIDLVITEQLDGADADLAFDMLCNAIGVSE
ncbi:MAG: TetR/AcrR family transcriptional regulator [Pseudomonadota bacterium]